MSSEIFDYINVLSEPIRVRMLTVLEREELTVGELTKVLGISQPSTSRHLKPLKVGGWVTRRSVGTTHLVQAALGEVPERARDLWGVVRAGVDGTEQHREDLARLERVLAARTVDSRSFFGRVAADWDRLKRELFGDAFTPAAMLALLDSDLTVADLGCGTGAVTEQLAQATGQVIAIDREDAMLEATRARVAGHDNVDVRKGELTDLPIEGEVVDRALCLLVLHHVADIGRALGEMARILRPGGRLVVVDMVPHDRTQYRSSMGHAHLGFDADQLEEAARGTSLTLRRCAPLPVDPSATGPGLFVAVFERKAAPADK